MIDGGGNPLHPPKLSGWRWTILERLVASAIIAQFGMVSGLTAMASPTDSAIASCRHATDLEARVAACTTIIRESRDKRALERAYNTRGLALCDLDRCKEAVADFEQVLRLDPAIAGYFDNQARALRAAGRFPEALEASERAIKMAPQYPFTYMGKAHALEDTKKFDDALAVVDQALRINEQNAGGWQFRGKILGELQRFSDSYAAYSRAFSIEPNRVSIYETRADTELLEGKPDAAMQDLSRYPAFGRDADQVRIKLQVVQAARDQAHAALEHSTTGARDQLTPTSASQASAIAAQEAIPSPQLAPSTNLPGTSPEPNTTHDTRMPAAESAADYTEKQQNIKCNLYYWRPVQTCIQEYYTENTPLPGGAKNPRQWNADLIASAQSFIGDHPAAKWDRTEWNAIVVKDAEDRASAQAKTGMHSEDESEGDDGVIKIEKPVAGSADSTSRHQNASSEIDTCNAPGVLEVIRKQSKEALKKVVFDLILANVQGAHFEFVGIRQLNYDASGEHRVCAMDRKLVLVYMPHTQRATERTAKPIQYEIDRQLDGNQGSYVTCSCKL